MLTDHSPNPPPVSWLVKDWMPDATLSVLSGTADAGKSRIALQIAVAVATGAEHFIQTESSAAMLSGIKAPVLLATGPVVFAAWETGLLVWQNRLAAVCGQGADRAERIRQLAGQLHYVDMRSEGGLWGAAQGAHTSTIGSWIEGGKALLDYTAQARLLIIDPSPPHPSGRTLFFPFRGLVIGANHTSRPCADQEKQLSSSPWSSVTLRGSKAVRCTSFPFVDRTGFAVDILVQENVNEP